MTRPLIGVTACIKPVVGEALVFHAAPDPYLQAVARAAGGEPVILPALGAVRDGLLARLDGVLLTGSRSNVHPGRYGGPPSAPGTCHDAARDATTLPLIHAALATGLPLLAICRGFQELNVALGGTLHQAVHAVPGLADHRAPEDTPEARFAPRHTVRLAGGLAELAGADRWQVNSVHGQGVDRLAGRLVAEAVAEPDGLIEAARVDGAGFAIGVQWHPEWVATEDAFAAALFAAFGRACADRMSAMRS